MSLLETRRVVLYTNDGQKVHFDVFVDFTKLAEMIGHKAQKSPSGRSRLQGGAVIVEHVP